VRDEEQRVSCTGWRTAWPDKELTRRLFRRLYAELDAFNDQDTARNHPLNCAALSAKPYPYFDGGLMRVG
jgi:hypothetical protein